MTIGARLTIAAIAIVAFALCDLVHEVIGHGLAVFFVPGCDLCQHRRFSPNAYFLWLFGAVNLLNGPGTTVFSDPWIRRLGSRGEWAAAGADMADRTGHDGRSRVRGAVVLSAGELARVVENDSSVERRDSSFCYWRTWSAAHCWSPHRLQSDRPTSHPVVRCQQRIRRDGWTDGYSTPG